MLTSCYPVLQTTDVAGAAAFFRDRLGFDVAFEADWYVSLRRGAFEIAVLDADHETIPAVARGRVASGLLIDLEVEDVDAEHARLVVDGGLEPLLELRSEPFGQRHFIIEGPEGALIDVITPIPPSDEFAAAFAGDAHPA